MIPRTLLLMLSVSQLCMACTSTADPASCVNAPNALVPAQTATGLRFAHDGELITSRFAIPQPVSSAAFRLEGPTPLHWRTTGGQLIVNLFDVASGSAQRLVIYVPSDERAPSAGEARIDRAGNFCLAVVSARRNDPSVATAPSWIVDIDGGR